MNATGQFIPTLLIFPGSKINHRSRLNATADAVAIVEKIGRTKTLLLPDFLLAVLTARQVFSGMVWRQIRQLSHKTAKRQRKNGPTDKKSM